MANEQATCNGESYHQFDFWLGEWDVYDQNNQLVGHNHIFSILNGCALSENWTGASGNQGVSYNFYDSATQQWHQTWIDQSGTPLFLDGGIENGKMVLAGYRPTPEGGQILHRITWTPMADGRVSQHWQSSTDSGQKWLDVFLGFYQKANKK